MTNKKATQFKLKDVQARAKELEKREKYYLDKEKTQFIYYYPKFNKKKVHELFVDLTETIQYVNKNGIPFPSNDLELIQYTQFLIIKHFTSLHGELKNKSFDVHIETMTKLLETGLFDKFIQDMFDQAEIFELLDNLNTMTEMGLEFMKQEQDTRELLTDKLQSSLLQKKKDE